MTALFLTGSGSNASQPTAADLLALTQSCNQVSNGLYPMDDGGTNQVPICQLNGAVWWRADMDIDCDGIETAQCNINTDPWFQPQTSFQDSHGNQLNATTLPFIVIPIPDAKFNYETAGLQGGSCVACIYNNQLVYGVFGDENGEGIIGEASYAMANALGINPDPTEGGIDGRVVTYIAFTGSSAVVVPIESHSAATALGVQLATALITNN